MFVIKYHKRDWNITRNSVGMNMGYKKNKKNALRLFSTTSQRKYTRVQFYYYAVRYTENIRSTEITDTKPTQPHYKKIFSHKTMYQIIAAWKLIWITAI
jgi:hypothetical protein